MPNNINHVVVGNETKLDLREDTVTPSTMVNGIVAHDASGVRIVGTFDPSIFVQKSGDTMTGSLTFSASNTNAIQYAGTKATYPMIKFIDNTSDTYGNGVAIGGGGQTIIGGGESSNVMIPEAGTSGAESMWIGNDNDVNVYSNLQNGWSSKKSFVFNSNGYLTVANGGMSTTDDITVNNATSEKVIRIDTQSGAQVALCFGTSLNQGIYSSGYTTNISDSSKYTPSGLWIICRGSDGSVNIPNWANTGNSTTPVYINATGKPVSTNTINRAVRLANYYKPEGGYGNRPTSPNISSENSGGVRVFLATSSMSTDYPGGDGTIFHCDWDNSDTWCHQLAVVNSGIKYRNQNQDKSWSEWVSCISTATSIGRTEFTPTYGSAGNPTKCWYAKYGKVVEVAMRVSGIAADSNNHQLYTLPSGYRPPTMIAFQAHGVGTNGAAPGSINDDGLIIVKGLYSIVDIHVVFLTT